MSQSNDTTTYEVINDKGVVTLISLDEETVGKLQSRGYPTHNPIAAISYMAHLLRQEGSNGIKTKAA